MFVLPRVFFARFVRRTLLSHRVINAPMPTERKLRVVTGPFTRPYGMSSHCDVSRTSCQIIRCLCDLVDESLEIESPTRREREICP